MVNYMRLSDLQSKDIISTKDGKIIGRIIDAEIDVASGKLKYLIAEPKKIFKNLISSKDTTIYFDQIVKIGEDVILVDIT